MWESSMLLQSVAEWPDRDRLDVGDLGRLGRPATRQPGEGQGGEVLHGPEGDDVDRDPGDDVVDAEDDGGDGMDEPTQHAHQDRAGDARPGTVVVAEVSGPPGAEDHHSLEADVDHAGALGPQAAETGQQDRDGGDQGRRHGAPGGEVVGPGDDPQQREQQHGPEQGDDDPPAREAPALGRRRVGRGALDGGGDAHAVTSFDASGVGGFVHREPWRRSVARCGCRSGGRPRS